MKNEMLMVPECLQKDGVASNYWAHVFFPWPEYKDRTEKSQRQKCKKMLIAVPEEDYLPITEPLYTSHGPNTELWF